MNPQKKATVQQTEAIQQALGNEHAQQLNAREFAGVEEMLRHDAAHTPVPPAIAQRLEASLSQLPAPPRRAWWRRILGGSAR